MLQRERMMFARDLVAPTKDSTGSPRKGNCAADSNFAAAKTVLNLQRTHGNAFVQRVIQRKLAVRQLGGGRKQEADRVADLVFQYSDFGRSMRTISHGVKPDVHRKFTEREEETQRPTVDRVGERVSACLQRQKTDEEENEDEEVEFDPVKELIHLNGRSMTDMLSHLSSMESEKFSQLQENLGRVSGRVHVPRLRAAFAAVASRGMSAANFGLAVRVDLGAIGFIGQINAILRFVDPNFKPPPPIGIGDKFRIDGKLAVLHQGGYVRVGSPTYVAFNPGAIGSGPSFDLVAYGAYPGKTVGAASIAVFPDESTGFNGLYGWITFNANRGMSFGGFFGAHAPKPKSGDDTANKGNDPGLYFVRVAEGMGYSDPEKHRSKLLSQVLSEKSIGDMARAMQGVEGWHGRTTTWEEGKVIDNKTRFRILYTSWVHPEVLMPPG